jgi:hypothetical protein
MSKYLEMPGSFLGPTQPPIQRIYVVFFPRVNRPGREVKRSLYLLQRLTMSGDTRLLLPVPSWSGQVFFLPFL